MKREKYSIERSLYINQQQASRLRETSADVFFDELDTTWMKGMPQKTRTFTILPMEYAEDDGTVFYEYSEDCFRSDRFTNEHNGKLHVLFAGDSEAEGYGANLGEFWPSIIYEQIKNECSGFFNLSKGGWGWEKIIANSLIYFDKYGKPDYMFILLPNIARLWHYMGEEEGWYYIQRYIFDEDNYPRKITNKIQEYQQNNPHDRTEYMNSFIRFVAGWKLFLKYCESEGINVVWSIWESSDAGNLERMYSFKNFVSLGSRDEILKLAAERAAEKQSLGTLKKNDVLRRDNHNGTITHEIWAEKLMEKAKDLGWSFVK